MRNLVAIEAVCGVKSRTTENKLHANISTSLAMMQMMLLMTMMMIVAMKACDVKREGKS